MNKYRRLIRPHVTQLFRILKRNTRIVNIQNNLMQTGRKNTFFQRCQGVFVFLFLTSKLNLHSDDDDKNVRDHIQYPFRIK